MPELFIACSKGTEWFRCDFGMLQRGIFEKKDFQVSRTRFEGIRMALAAVKFGGFQLKLKAAMRTGLTSYSENLSLASRSINRTVGVKAGPN